MIYGFGDFEFDTELWELRRCSVPVGVQPKVLQLLLYLLEQRERVVSKEELLREVWPDTIVGEGALTRAVNLARHALGDGGREQAIVRTHARRGYRFTAAVQIRQSGPELPQEVERARAACRVFDWDQAITLYEPAEKAGSLGPRDVERLAWARRWATSGSSAMETLARAQAAYLDEGDARGAARCALQLARMHFEQGDDAPAAGAMLRAVALLEDVPECEEHALAAYQLGRAVQETGDVDAAFEHADRALEIARRVGSRDAEALALTDRGHILAARGEIEEATALQDEALAAALGGELGLQAAGTVYCSVIWGCRTRGDWQRASQWTDQATQWVKRVHLSFFPGLCQLHRAEVLRLRAEFEEAEREVLSACDRMLAMAPRWAGATFNEVGEIRLRRGDLAGAREAFGRAIELGVLDPEPGLARLRVEEGDPEGALRGLERALSQPIKDIVIGPVPLLCAKVSAALAAGRREVAREALSELAANPSLWKMPAHRAAVLAVDGELTLADGDPARAIDLLRESVTLWREVGAPYEGARVEVVLGEALRETGDHDSAAMVLEGARATFERTEARRDARRVAARLIALAASSDAQQKTDHAVRTFLFTDIVGSTRLVELLGDDDWETLRRWHHRTLQAAFQAHGGEVVGPHEGDGFFVAFANAAAAVECGAAIQQQLATHRERHGFAPQVRIGAHTADAVRRGGDYAGRGVHVAARIAAAAAGGELLVSTETRDAAGNRFAYAGATPVDVGDDTPPVEVARAVWNELAPISQRSARGWDSDPSLQ